jgi:hypothetical protein
MAMAMPGGGYPPPTMMPGHPPPPPIMQGFSGGYAPAGMTTMMMQQQQPQHQHPHPRPSPATASTTPLVLLTHVPACLHHPRAVRDWIVSCGNARSVMLVPPPARPKRTAGSSTKKSEKPGGGSGDDNAKVNNVVDADVVEADDDEESDDDEEDRDLVPSSRLPTVTGLITMSHPEAAVRFAAAFKSFHAKLVKQEQEQEQSSEADSNNTDAAFSAHLVPLSNPEIPLPPLAAGLDPTVVDALGEQLRKSYEAWKSGDRDHLLAGYWGTSQHHSDSAEATSHNETTTNLPQKRARNYLDDDDDDEDDDDDMPSNEHLKSPEVRQAVQAFRRKIERLNTTKSSRRKQIVLDRVAAMLPTIRDQVQREMERERSPAPAPPPPAGPGMMMMMPPPPPPPGHPATAAPPPPRGVSNLPAWMTSAAAQQQPPQQADTSSTLDSAVLQSFVSSQIQKYLGEDEPTLGEFVVRKVVEVVAAGSSASAEALPESIRTALLPDLQDVLDEDSDAFIQAVVAHVQTML